MKKTTSFFILISLLLFFSCGDSKNGIVVTGETMGTTYQVKVHGVNSKHDRERIQLAVDAVLTRIHFILNTWNPESQISKFNLHKGKGAFPVAPEFIRITETAQKIYKLSQGAYDPTVKPLVELWGFGNSDRDSLPLPETIDSTRSDLGMDKLTIFSNGILKKNEAVQLDFSSIAKGYGVDLLAESLEQNGYDNFLVEIGGEIIVKGKNQGNPWTIGIAAPRRSLVWKGYMSSSLQLSGKACATSGDYQQYYIRDGKRYSHLIDPRTGYPIKHSVTSVTVVADECMIADALSTAAIVMGAEKGLKLIEDFHGADAFFILRSGDYYEIRTTNGWKDLIKE